MFVWGGPQEGLGSGRKAPAILQHISVVADVGCEAAAGCALLWLPQDSFLASLSPTPRMCICPVSARHPYHQGQKQ